MSQDAIAVPILVAASAANGPDVATMAADALAGPGIDAAANPQAHNGFGLY